MNSLTQRSVLIVEPNQSLTIPYMYLPNTYTLTCVSSIRRARNELAHTVPDLVFLSTSFRPAQTLSFLEELKKVSQSKTRIIPIVFVIDLSQRVSYVLGTTWAGKVGFANSQSSAEELFSTLERIL